MSKASSAAASVAAVALVTPAFLFLVSAAARLLQPTQYQPARTFEAIFEAFQVLPPPVGLLLVGLLPPIGVVLGSVVLWRSLTVDDALREDVILLSRVAIRLLRRPAAVLSVIAVAAGGLAILSFAMHAIVG